MGAYQKIAVIFFIRCYIAYKLISTWSTAMFGSSEILGTETEYVIIDNTYTVRNNARKILQTPCIPAPEMVVESRQAWNSAKWECQFGNHARKFGVTAEKMHFEHPTIWQKICSTYLEIA